MPNISTAMSFAQWGMGFLLVSVRTELIAKQCNIHRRATGRA